MAEKKRLGEVLVESGLITEETLNRALKMQVGGIRRLGRILVKIGAITSDQLLETLSGQFQMPIVNPEQEFALQGRKVLPRYLCRKYEVLPLDFEGDAIIKVAMADPSDAEAIIDIENYTGRAVQPCLARQADIHRAITRFTTLSLADLFNPQSYIRYAKIVSTLALALALITAGLTYRFYHQAKYGTVTRAGATVMYKNLDLMVGKDPSGTVTLLGRGAHASGYYSITFGSTAALAQFIETKKEDLSSGQYQWVQWALATMR